MKKNKPLKGLVKDTATFAGGSMIIGAGSLGVAAVGGNAAGLATLGTGMRAVAPLIPMKATVGMLSETTKQLKPRRKK